MIKRQYNFFINLRKVITVILLLLISFKISSVAVTITPDVKKEIIVDTNDNDGSKIKTSFEKEFIEVTLYCIDHSVLNTPVLHYTAYDIKYRSLYYNRITVPPPDYLHLPLSS